MSKRGRWILVISMVWSGLAAEQCVGPRVCPVVHLSCAWVAVAPQSGRFEKCRDGKVVQAVWLEETRRRPV